MTIHLDRRCLVAAIALAWSACAIAQSHDGHTRENETEKAAPSAHGSAHAAMDHDSMGHDSMDHAGMQHATPRQAGSPPPSDHVPPPAPAHEMGAMSNARMVDVMGMDDRATFGLFALDRLEHVAGDGNSAAAWSAQGWLGGDFDKLWFRSEGVRRDGAFEHADVELSWSHAIAPFWDGQLGVRRDVGRGPDRSWAAFGVQGLAPYWFELAATAYVGEQGRTALRFEAEYEALLTQRWIVQPRVELNAYGKDDPALHVGSGLSDAAFGLRLRYEIRREFAPYVGVEWSRRFGRSADFARAEGGSAGEMQWVAGVRVWF